MCPDCVYQEVTKETDSVKTFVLITECDTCRAKREAQAAQEAVLRPYLEPDIRQIKLDLKSAFQGNLGALGGIYAILSGYLDSRNWNGFNECLNDLITEGSLTTDQVNVVKNVLMNHNIDLDNIPAGV